MTNKTNYSKARFYCCGKAFSNLTRMNMHKMSKRHSTYVKKGDVVED